MTDSRSINRISRNFVIPPGSQVVMQVAKKVQLAEKKLPTNSTTETGETNKGDFDKSTAEVRKPGAVGVVIKSPPHNDQPYLVEFADGSKVELTFDELVLRRQEINALLADDGYDYSQHVIYRCMVGSKAFGLAHESSDDDLRGIFLPPAEKNWSLYEVPEQIELTDGQDEVYWELEKFLRLALKANPNILETLWTPMVLECNPIATELRELRSSFLSKHIFKTYSGYVLSQFRRMKNSFEKTGKFKHKHAMHLVRLIHSGIAALETGEIMVDVSEHRESLLAIKSGTLSFEEIREKALKLNRRFQVAFDKTDLPEQPDFKRVNEFLIRARRSAAG